MKEEGSVSHIAQRVRNEQQGSTKRGWDETPCHGENITNEECRVDGPIRSTVWAYWNFGSGSSGKPDINRGQVLILRWRHGYY